MSQQDPRLHRPGGHYSPGEWADFVRGLAADEYAMQSHLDTQCVTCLETVAWLQQVSDSAQAFAALPDPPAHLVDRAKAVFDGSRTSASGLLSGWKSHLAELVLTSSGDWLPAGVRAGSAAGERLLYRAGDYSIDLTMDEGLAFGQAGEIVGQLSMGSASLLRQKAVVQLETSGNLVGETETNEFGEFVLHRPNSKPATLQFLLAAEGKKIEVRLKGDGE